MIDPHLPLIDLHRHLDGNIRVKTIWDLAVQHNLALPASSLSDLPQYCQIQTPSSDLMGFLSKLDLGVSVLADADACYRVAYENVEDATNEGLDYVELRFSPYYMSRAFALPMSAVIEAVLAGVGDASKHFAVKVNVIGILSRTFGLDTCAQELAAILAFHKNIVAVDLAGDELGYPAELFTDLFAKARALDMHVTVHAGEADGASSVWNSITLLGATRIGHGIRSIEDPKLIDTLIARNIGLECCITSNYHTGTHTDMATHPVKALLESGVSVSLNTDDPGVSNNTLAEEFSLAASRLMMSAKQLSQLQKNALEQAFLSVSEKQALLQSKQ